MKEDVVTKIAKSMLRLFGHVERMSESCLTKGDASDNAGRGCPRRCSQYSQPACVYDQMYECERGERSM